MPLTDTMLRKLKSDGTPTKLADSEGLYLYFLGKSVFSPFR